MYIESVSSYIPETFLSVKNYCEKIGVASSIAEMTVRFHGVQRIPYAHDISYGELIEKPLIPLIENLDVTHIKYLIHCCAYSSWPYGHFALSQLQERLRLFDTQLFSVNIHECASTITGFEILASLLADEDEQCKAILVASDMEVNPMRGLPLIVNGDASAAIVVSNKRGDHRLVCTHLSSNARFANGIWRTTDEERDYQKNFHSMVESNFTQCLSKAGLSKDSIKYVLPLNTSITVLSILAQHLGFSPDKFYTKNVSKTAHCFGADILINLESLLSEQLIHKGDYYMMFLVGSSGYFGTAIFQY